MADVFTIITDWTWCDELRPQLQLHRHPNGIHVDLVIGPDGKNERVGLSGPTSVEDLVSVFEGYIEIFKEAIDETRRQSGNVTRREAGIHRQDSYQDDQDWGCDGAV